MEECENFAFRAKHTEIILVLEFHEDTQDFTAGTKKRPYK